MNIWHVNKDLTSQYFFGIFSWSSICRHDIEYFILFFRISLKTSLRFHYYLSHYECSLLEPALVDMAWDGLYWKPGAWVRVWSCTFSIHMSIRNKWANGMYMCIAISSLKVDIVHVSKIFFTFIFTYSASPHLAVAYLA